MLHLRINDTDYTNYLEDDSLKISDQIQNTSNTADFNLINGATSPSYSQDTQIYDSVPFLADLTDGMVGWWRFNEGSGSTALDSSIFRNNGTISGATFVEGLFGTALDFDGTNDYVQIIDSEVIQNIWDGGGRVSFWIDPDSDGESNIGRILDKTASGATGWFILLQNETATGCRLVFQHYFDGAADGTWITPVDSILLNERTHIVIDYNSYATTNDPIIYINGVSVSVTEQATPIGARDSDIGNDLYIGNRSGNDRTFDGIIEDVRIYSLIHNDSNFVSYLSKGGNLVVQDKLASGLSILDYNKFREGQSLYLGIGTSDEEKVIISAVREGDVSNTVNIEFENIQENIVGSLLIHTCNYATSSRFGNWSANAGTDALNVTTDSTLFKYGNRFAVQGGCVNFDIDVSQSAANNAEIDLTSTTTHNLTNYEDTGKFRMWVYIPSITNLTNISFFWGSSLSDTWYKSVTTDYYGDALAAGWNYVEFDWASASDSGTPVVTAVDTFSLLFVYAAGYVDQTDCRLDHVRLYDETNIYLVGKKIFAGTISSLSKENPKLLTDVEFDIGATDYTKIFDRKLVNDSWEDVDARYVINDFCNSTINYNKLIDSFEYADNAAIQAVWAESGDGNNPTTDSSDYQETIYAGDFSYTFNTGAGSWLNTTSLGDYSDFVGVSSGLPTKGWLGFWMKCTDSTTFGRFLISIGSAAGARCVYDFIIDSDNDGEWVYYIIDLRKPDAIAGTPDWTAIDYVQLALQEITSSSSFTIDGMRILADGYFAHYPYIETSSEFDDIRSSFLKPTVFLDKIADTLGKYWYIDYDKNIRLFDRETNVAPFTITSTSDNFEDLTVDIDTSQLKNRQVVRGGTKTSDSYYKQVVEGDGASREWLMKSLFSGLTIYMDNNTSTDTCEAGTTTTNVTATTHGLVTGDYIVNRTRSNAVRQITLVDPDNFTVETVTAQTNGDTFSKFATNKTVGVEFLVDETTVDYVSNYNEKSIRATDATATLVTSEFLLFSYYEIIPIRVSVQDNASIATMKALTGGDGVYDGAVITDESLDSTQACRDRAQAEIDAYSNALVEIDFDTNYEGLESGQIISVTDSGKGINDNYVIQKVKIKYNDGMDFPDFSVTCASSLFGLIEYFQQLSISLSERLIDEDETVDLITGENVTITLSEVNTIVPAESASESPTITITATSDTVTERDVTTDPYVWQPDASDSRWNLAQWG